MFYATDILFICLMTCVDNSPSWGLLRYAPEAEWISLIYVDNKPLKRCKISVARTLEQCEDPYWGNYIYMLVLVYGYVKYGFVLSKAICWGRTIGLKIIVLCSIQLE